MSVKHGKRTIAQWLAFALALLALLVCGLLASRTAAAAINPPPGGPILVVTSGTPTFGDYYAEILRNEGFNAYAVADIAQITSTPATLNNYDVVLLAKMTLTPAQVTILSNWVNAGGNLIAMAPDSQLAGLLGLTATGSTLSNGYLLVNTAQSPGTGIVNQTIQFHGTADRYTLNGATGVATLYNSATAASTNPAVTLRTAGSGKAAAFVYDLATSIVYTRQGNPAWATQERDGFSPIRSDDKFYGNATGDPQSDWIDLNKVAIPQADEQQRLLANLILHMNQGKKPLPRFWYFPRGKKAVVIMTGDDHGNGGTIGRFDQFKSLSPAGCSVANWECIRGTSYVYASTPSLTNALASGYNAEGFEVGLHLTTNCSDFTQTSLNATYNNQLSEWQDNYSSIPAPRTMRHHCIVFSDWATAAQAQLARGMRFDTNYYFWPPGWVADTPGMFTGSAMPMRFSGLNGSLIDVYQAATHMTDESGQSFPFTIDTLLDRALGQEGYYGAYTINAHTDLDTIPESSAVVASALARAVPVVSSRQMLDWLDGRNGSSFGSIAWNSSTLSFTLSAGVGANGLRAMLPIRFGSSLITSLTRGGAPANFTVDTIKGIDYAFFDGVSGNYVATYGNDTTAPTVTVTLPAAGATGVDVAAAVSATFSEQVSPTTVNASTVELRGPGSALVGATISYDSVTQSARIVPSAALAGSTTYTATIRGGATDPRVKDLAGNALAGSLSWSFTTDAGPPPPSCPCSGWGATATPTNPLVNDTDAVELGVKFRTDVSGFITGIRFYKGGTANGGTHIGNLWTLGGVSLASAQFTNETATGWQQVNFASPVAITAGTVYVASYFAPNGNYAGDNGFFASSGVDNGPVHLLRDGVSGANGLYKYGPGSSFPTDSFQSSNYWVDVVFTTTTGGGGDTTPPTVTTRTPIDGATGVSSASVVTATFNEAIDQATVTSSTFELRNAGGTLIGSTVSYNPATRTATLTPSSALAASTTFTARLIGGTTDPRVKDVAGNALAATASWSFTTASASLGCPCSGWPGSAVPATPSDPDTAAVELGVKFRADVDGFITGVRFYKSSANTGTHVGHLWTSGGQLLATATFTGETASGWQQVDFGSPVAITANTVYVASYHAPNGHYANDDGFFASSGVDNPPVHLLQNGVNGANGVYAYGAAGTFPQTGHQSTNYWVDVVFTASTAPDTTPPTIMSTSPASGVTGVTTGSTVTATFNEAIDQATISGSTFELRNPQGTLVTATVSYDPAARTATLAPSSLLAASTTYTATLRGGSTEPTVKDLAGNALAANFPWSFTTGTAAGGCASPPNPIVAENCLTGNPDSEWDISGVGDSTIQGFATDISVNRGSTVSFKVDTTATSIRFDIYRMGYYGGMGARKVDTVPPSATLAQNQPNCLTNATTGLIDCGNWAVSGSWAVPATAVSGIYFAKVVRTDTGGASHIVFVVRDDASTSDLLFQTSDTTWQAYNEYGGNSLYTGSPAGRAYKVSYNRPFNTRIVAGGQDWVFNAEYPMVRWLEANGYDVSYFTGVDSDRSGPRIRQHRTFLSVGHDEYWSGDQFANVQAARNAGVHLAFFSGNEVFWKTRWENSTDGSNTPYRTLVTYKETHANAKIDPDPAWTGTWRDPRFSPPADGGRPENALTGTIFMANDTGTPYAITVPAADGKMRFWRNTSVAALTSGSATLPVGTLGYEWDSELDNGARPPGLVRMSTTSLTMGGALQDYGSTYGNGTVTHYLTLYKHASGARVFGAGTIQWSWGLDSNHDRGSTAADVRMQQATVNLLADMGAQPGSIRSGLVLASASTDNTAPTSTITSPTAGANVTPNSTVTITGAAADTGGGVVGGVEISVDGGTTWHPVTGRGAWTYSWSTGAAGSRTIRTRAVDDSGNLEAPGAGITVTVGSVDTTPPTITGRVPDVGATGVSQTANVTVNFSEAMDATTISNGTIELRDPSNALVAAAVTYGANVATLNPTPTLAAQAVYTVIVRGGGSGVKDAAGNPLTGDATWTFTTAPDTTAPTITARTPAVNATGIGQTSNVIVTFSEAMNVSTISATTFQLSHPTDGVVTATVSYNATTNVATLDPTPTLGAQTLYTVTVGGASGVKDLAGNALAVATWSFTTGGDGTPPAISARTPAIGATGVSQTANITVTFNEAMDATTISGSTFALRDAANQLVTAVVSYNATSRVATLNPTPTLAAQAVYTATVQGGANGVKDAAGNPLPVVPTNTWSFTTGGDATPPTITAMSPVNSATNVALSANVTATFSEAMTSSSITTTTFELRDAVGNLVPRAVSYSSTTRIATLNPSGTLALSAGTVYTATVKGGASGVRDSAGNPVANDVSWSFTTEPPAVTATVPASNATGVSRTANLTATFNGPMNLSTITGTTFELRGPGGVLVPAVVTSANLSAGNTRATLNPNATLAAATTYTATVKGGASGVITPTGIPLAVDWVWSFTTP